MHITGKLKAKLPIKYISGNFYQRGFVLTVDTEKYPQHILLHVSNEKCHEIEKYAPGTELTAHFNIEGKEWIPPKGGDAVYFTTLKVWRIDLVKNLEVSTYPKPSFGYDDVTDKDDDDNAFDFGDDDLPF